MIKKIACIIMVVVVLFSSVLVPRNKAYATGLEVNAFYMLYYQIANALGYTYSSTSDVALTNTYNEFYDYYNEDATRQLAIQEIAQDIEGLMDDGTLRYSGTWIRREAWNILISAIAEFNMELIQGAQKGVGDFAYKITYDTLVEGAGKAIAYSQANGMYDRKYYITYTYAGTLFTLSSNNPFSIKKDGNYNWLYSSGQTYRYQFANKDATVPLDVMSWNENVSQFAVNSSNTIEYHYISNDAAIVLGQAAKNPYTQIEVGIEETPNYFENIDDYEKDVPIAISVPGVGAISTEFEKVDVQAGTSEIVTELDITKSVPIDILTELIAFNFDDFQYTGGLPSIDNIMPWHYVIELLGKGARGINFILRIYNEIPYDVRLCGYATIVVCLFGGLVIKMGGV